MKNPVKSIFNLIEIFRTSRKKVTSPVVAEKHCKTKSLHDYYCDKDKSLTS